MHPFLFFYFKEMKNILVLSLFALLASFEVCGQELTPAQLVQQQLDGYNQRNIELFLKPYSDTVKIFNFPNKLTTSGKETMRKGYGNMFQNMPDLNCTLMNRMVLGNTVIDQEYVIFQKGKPAAEVMAIYKIKGQKITEVYFIRKDQ